MLRLYKGHSKRNEPEALERNKPEAFKHKWAVVRNMQTGDNIIACITKSGSNKSVEVHCPLLRGSQVQVMWLKASTLAKIQVGGHPPYSPDLSPCNYAIFGPLKKGPKGRQFTSDDVKQYMCNWLSIQPQEFEETAIHRFVSLWDNSQDQYFWHTGTGFCS